MSGVVQSEQHSVQQSAVMQEIQAWLQQESRTQTPYESILITGAAASGKTTIAFEALLYAIHQYGANQAVMTVANRTLADTLIRKAVQQLGALSVDRPITTLSALAFKLASQVAAARGEKPIRLLNGAQQDAIIRTIIARHGLHIVQGETCDTCHTIEEYFGTGNWLDIVCPSAGALHVSLAPEIIIEHIARELSDTLMNQLRDMLARIGEIGVSDAHMQRIIDDVARADQDIELVRRGERLAVQWRLALAIRAEVHAEVESAYPYEQRLDPTTLIEAGYKAACDIDSAALPRLVIVDDAHDMTLAQLRLISALYERGVRILVTANADESVQSFRGAFPEYVVLRLTGEDTATSHITTTDTISTDNMSAGKATVRDTAQVLTNSSFGNMHVRVLRLPAPYDEHNARYLDRVASRISLSIATSEEDPRPVADRYGKAPVVEGALPIQRRGAWLHDDSVHGHVYRSPYEEREDIIRSMRAIHDQGTRWADMAIITHDNASVQQFGRALREQGVPVEFSSRTLPVAEDPTVQGLFAAIELAQVRACGVQQYVQHKHSSSVWHVQKHITQLLRTCFTSPLCTMAPDQDAVYPQALHSLSDQYNTLDNALRLICQLAHIAVQDQAADTQVRSELAELIDAWNHTYKTLDHNISFHTTQDERIHIDQSIIADTAQPTADTVEGKSDSDKSRPLTPSALLLLAVSEKQYADMLISILHSLTERYARRSWNSRMLQVVERVYAVLHTVSEALQGSERDQAVAYIVDTAWQAFAVADYWQVLALQGASEEDELSESEQALIRATSTRQIAAEANTRLDTMIRLFAHAQEFTQQHRHHSIDQFIMAMNGLRLEADSLAKQTPQLDAVQVMTPASSVGKYFPYVWIPSLQQGTWPNLTPRGTMFGIEELAHRVLHGSAVAAAASHTSGAQQHSNAVLSSMQERLDQRYRVLASEQRLLLMAVTRATTRLTVSAVHNDDLAMSDFATLYLPELFWNPMSEEHRQELVALSGEPDDGEGRVPRTAQVPYTLASSALVFHGMVTDPRLFVAAARMHSIAGAAADAKCEVVTDNLAVAEAEQMSSADTSTVGTASHTVAADNNADRTDVDYADANHVNTDYAVAADRVEADRADADRATVDRADADRALALLAAHQFELASPRTWAFVHDAAQAAVAHKTSAAEASETIQDADTHEQSLRTRRHTHATDYHSDATRMVSLTPSNVESINECPICWKLSRELSGPTVSGERQKFGNWMHAVAQEATVQQLDMPHNQPGESEERKIEQLKNRLRQITETLRAEHDNDESGDDYQQLLRNRDVEAVIDHLATYFVLANNPAYGVNTSITTLKGNAKKPIGRLDAAFAEQAFSSHFAVSMIIDSLRQGFAQHARSLVETNDEPCDLQLTSEQIIALWKLITPAWSQDPHQPVDIASLQINLHGNIDRIEFRTLPHGQQIIRIIDYKTGSFRSKEAFNHMQLMCYQLGLHYGTLSSEDTSMPAEFIERAHHNPIAQAELFTIIESEIPAKAYNAEVNYQPALFGFDGGVLGGDFEPRSHMNHLSSLWQCTTWPSTCPAQFDEHIWALLTSLKDTQTMWVAYMTGMLVRAAVASLAQEFTVTEVLGKHSNYCQFTTVCPSCAEHISTVIEQ